MPTDLYACVMMSFLAHVYPACRLVEPPELFDQLKKKMLIKHITADQLFTWMDQKKR